jgi:hypothetical protein
MKCLGCGTEALVEGTVTDSGGDGCAFRPADTSRFAKMFGLGGYPVRAYACPACGRLEAAVDFTEEQRRKHLSFHGQQPGVLDRIGAADDE